MTAWLGYWLGLTDPSGGPYLFWSGLGADLTEFAIIGGLINLARKHNCHVHGCIRVGRHPVEGTTHVVCRRHHPDGPLRAADVAEPVIAPVIRVDAVNTQAKLDAIREKLGDLEQAR